MPSLHIIAVGKIRTPHWKNATEAYTGRLRRGYDIAESIVKDGDASLAPPERMEIEGSRILQAVKPNEFLICLDETGTALTSEAFARLLRTCFDTARPPCFVVGGAYGLSQAVRDRASKILSFGPMTFPHELARVLLMEQLYRADAILHGRPYHHA